MGEQNLAGFCLQKSDLYFSSNCPRGSFWSIVTMPLSSSQTLGESRLTQVKITEKSFLSEKEYTVIKKFI